MDWRRWMIYHVERGAHADCNTYDSLSRYGSEKTGNVACPLREDLVIRRLAPQEPLLDSENSPPQNSVSTVPRWPLTLSDSWCRTGRSFSSRAHWTSALLTALQMSEYLRRFKTSWTMWSLTIMFGNIAPLVLMAVHLEPFILILPHRDPQLTSKRCCWCDLDSSRAQGKSHHWTTSHYNSSFCRRRASHHRQRLGPALQRAESREIDLSGVVYLIFGIVGLIELAPQQLLVTNVASLQKLRLAHPLAATISQ